MSFFKKLFSAMVSSQELRGRRLVRDELLALPAHRLSDLGFDRASLISGVKAWPWRLEDEGFVAPETESQPVLTRREIRKAERELGAMSDRELFELGIARSDIHAAVNGTMNRAA